MIIEEIELDTNLRGPQSNKEFSTEFGDDWERDLYIYHGIITDKEGKEVVCLSSFYTLNKPESLRLKFEFEYDGSKYYKKYQKFFDDYFKSFGFYKVKNPKAHVEFKKTYEFPIEYFTGTDIENDEVYYSIDEVVENITNDLFKDMENAKLITLPKDKSDNKVEADESEPELTDEEEMGDEIYESPEADIDDEDSDDVDLEFAYVCLDSLKLMMKKVGNEEGIKLLEENEELILKDIK